MESAPALAQLDAAVLLRTKVKRGRTLLHHGQVFKNVYAVRTGFSLPPCGAICTGW
jgi:hypothetical protein